MFNNDLIRYNSWANQQIIAILNANGQKPSGRCLELMHHIMDVHQIWNARISPESFTNDSGSAHSQASLAEVDRLNTEVTLGILIHPGADHTIKFQTKSGATFTNLVQEIIFQIITHSTYHRGQIALELRNHCIEPVMTDYVYYKMTEAN